MISASNNLLEISNVMSIRTSIKSELVFPHEHISKIATSTFTSPCQATQNLLHFLLPISIIQLLNKFWKILSLRISQLHCL